MFKIMPFGGQAYRGDYADHYDIRQYLGLNDNSKLPIDFEGVWPDIPTIDGRTTTLHVYRGKQSTIGWRGKSSAHRVFATCPDCGVEVPAGRAHQHKCK